MPCGTAARLMKYIRNDLAYYILSINLIRSNESTMPILQSEELHSTTLVRAKQNSLD